MQPMPLIHAVTRTERTDDGLAGVCTCGLRVMFPDSVEITMADVRRGMCLADGHAGPNGVVEDQIIVLEDFRVGLGLREVCYYVRCRACGWASSPLPLTFAMDARARHECARRDAP